MLPNLYDTDFYAWILEYQDLPQNYPYTMAQIFDPEFPASMIKP